MTQAERKALVFLLKQERHNRNAALYRFEHRNDGTGAVGYEPDAPEVHKALTLKVQEVDELLGGLQEETQE